MSKQLVPVHGRNPLSTARQITQGASNVYSVLGLFALFVSGMFLLLGFYLFLARENPAVPLFFFPVVIAFMVGYAMFYGGHASGNSQFRAGSISARFVIRTMAAWTQASFAIAIAYILSHNWEPMDWYATGHDPGFFAWMYSFLMDGVVGVFAVTYASYVDKANSDMLPSEEWRGGSGRRTIVVLSTLTMLVFGAHLIGALPSMDPSPIFYCALAFAGSLALCAGCYATFQSKVSVEEDRGSKAS